MPVYAVMSGTSLFNAPPYDTALQAIIQGVLTPIVSYWLYRRAVGILGASNGSVFAALSPVTIALVSIPLLGEWPMPTEWITIVLISAGVYVASRDPGRPNASG